MKNLSLSCTVLGIVAAVVGAVSRFGAPIVTNARVWAGSAAILLLIAIALNTLPGKNA
jgi:hypothetical protein